MQNKQRNGGGGGMLTLLMLLGIGGGLAYASRSRLEQFKNDFVRYMQMKQM